MSLTLSPALSAAPPFIISVTFIVVLDFAPPRVVNPHLPRSLVNSI